MENGVGRDAKCTRKQFYQFLRIFRIFIAWRDSVRHTINGLSSLVVTRKRLHILQPANLISKPSESWTAEDGIHADIDTSPQPSKLKEHLLRKNTMTPKIEE